MKSIMQDEKVCYFSDRTDNLEMHHIFPGPNRKHSEKYGLKVYLTHDLHNEPPDGVHFNRARSDALKRAAQKKFEETHTREEFMKIFGRNYVFE
ncbi:MAG TPA: hypothetical protein DEQ02_05635 [Ruminococcaceae bacterium]|nr:hypothetical protein [Oscillospiraceae bacterium]